MASSKLGVETYPSYVHLFKKTHTHTEDPGGWEIRFFNFLVWKQVSDQNVSQPCFCEQQKTKGSKLILITAVVMLHMSNHPTHTHCCNKSIN